MKIIRTFLIGGAISSAESIPIIGPFLVTPVKISAQIISSIAKLAFMFLTIFTLSITATYFLFNVSIRILSSITSLTYQVFTDTKKTI